MLEAFCDLTDFPALAEQPAVQAVYAPLHDLEEQSVSGDLLTNIFAGGTVTASGLSYRLHSARGLPQAH